MGCKMTFLEMGWSLSVLMKPARTSSHLHDNMDVRYLESQQISQMYLLEEIGTRWLLQSRQKAISLPMLCLGPLMLSSSIISLLNKWYVSQYKILSRFSHYLLYSYPKCSLFLRNAQSLSLITAESIITRPLPNLFKLLVCSSILCC
jgi:hypothetical protein